MASQNGDAEMDWTDDESGSSHSSWRDDGLNELQYDDDSDEYLPDPTEYWALPGVAGGPADQDPFIDHEDGDNEEDGDFDDADFGADDGGFLNMLAQYSAIQHHNHHHHHHHHHHASFFDDGDDFEASIHDGLFGMGHGGLIGVGADGLVGVGHDHIYVDAMSVGLPGVRFASRLPTAAETITNVLLAAGPDEPTPAHVAANKGWEPPLFPVGEPPDDDDWDPSPALSALELGMEERDLGRLPLQVNVLCRRSRRRIPIMETKLSMAEAGSADDTDDDDDDDDDGYKSPLHLFPPNRSIYKFGRFKAAVKRNTGLKVEPDTVMVASLHFEGSIERGRMCEVAWNGVMISLELTVKARQRDGGAAGGCGPAAMVVDIIV